MTCECKPVKYAIYSEGQNPIYGDFVLTIEVDDEAAGPFLKIRVNGEHQERGTVEIDYQHWAALDKAARQLMKDFDYE